MDGVRRWTESVDRSAGYPWTIVHQRPRNGDPRPPRRWHDPCKPTRGMARRHENRAVAIIAQLLGDAGTMTSEHAVPRAARRIDVVMEIGDAPAGFGLLAHDMALRTVVLEHFSRPVTGRLFARAVARAAHLVDDWWHQGREKRAPRVPLLVVLSTGHPGQLLEGRTALEAGEVTGMWWMRRPILGDIVVLDLLALPRDHPGAAVLRLLATPPDRAAAEQAIDAVFDDPSVLHSIKRRLLEAFMSGTIPSSHMEQESWWDRAMREGREQGVREGREQGQRAALLGLVRDAVGDEAADALGEIQDLDALRARVRALLRRDP